MKIGIIDFRRLRVIVASSEVALHWSKRSLPDFSNSLLGANITGRKLMQSQLAQAQKLESIGLLAAGIAHEINTPIQYIGDNMLFLQESFHDLSTLLEHYAALYQMCTEGIPTASILSQIDTTAAAID